MERTYWFKIEGKIYAESEDLAYEQLRSMAEVGKNCERATYEVTEETD